MYKPLRIDLTDSIEKCHFCPKLLRSYKTRVLENIETGEIVNAGPTCASKYIAEGYNLKDIPDLTRCTRTIETRNSSTKRKNSVSSAKKEIDQQRQRAIEYILLREVKLRNVRKNISYKPLYDYYRKYLTTELTDNDIRHINNIEAKSPDSFKLDFLQQAYNAYFWIDIALKKLSATVDKSFLESIKKWIESGNKLTELQLTAINNWLKNLDETPIIK